MIFNRLPAMALVLATLLASPASAQFFGWGGGYVGGSVGSTSFEEASGSPVGEGASIALHGGFNVAVIPNVVFGGELSLSPTVLEDSTTPSETFGYMTTLRARAGFTMDNILIYGALGYAAAVYDNGLGTDAGNGTMYAYGAEYKFTPLTSVRLEVSHTKIDDFVALPTTSFETDTISLGASLHF
ncbi:MAG: outer membrane beta-barrel protein [Rhodobacteraceae bacterium]|nr:outer membrane beta-barrel protein [Paracoccaceae bacterium]